MSRTAKRGIDYFPLDVDFFSDIKIRKLIKYQGSEAIAVYATLLCNIYKDEGYYMRWDDDLPFIISESTKYDEDYIRSVIACCVEIGLFSKELYESEGVLTSKGIQTRYKDINRQCKRTARVTEYSLIPSEEMTATPNEKDISSEEKAITSEEKGISSEEIAITSEEMPQSKEKKSKENKIKENLSRGNARAGEERVLLEKFIDSDGAKAAAAIDMKPERWRETARAVLDEWELTGKVHETDADARSHLISHVRRKVKAEPNRRTQPTPAERRALAAEKERRRAEAEEAERREKAERAATGKNSWQRFCESKGIDPKTSAAEYAKSQANADEAAALDEFRQQMTKTD